MAWLERPSPAALSSRWVPGLARSYSYRTNGYLSQLTDSSINATQSFTWQNGLLSTYTDALGLQRTFTWDNLSRVTGVSFPDGTTLRNQYTALDLTATKDRLGNWTTFTFNGVRQMTSMTDARSNTTHYAYCDCGALEAITNALNEVTSFGYDLLGRQTNVVYHNGTTFSRGFNRLGQLTSVWDSLATNSMAYNLQGLLTNAANAYGTQFAAVYDNVDRATTVTSADGVAVSQTFDAAGRVLSRSYPDNGVERFQYSFSGLTAYTNQLTNIWCYTYDAAGRRIQEVTPNNETNACTFDKIGDLLTLTDGKSHTTTWIYSVEGLMTNKTVAGGATVQTNRYDANGRLTRRWTPAMGSQDYTLDALGNVTAVSNPAVTNQFDALNRLTNMVDAVGTTQFTYTGAGDVASEVGPWSNSTVTYSYHSSAPHMRLGLNLGQPTGSWTNGFTWDGARRLSTVTSPSGTFTYTLNGPGNIWTNLALPVSTSHIAKTLDNVARLSSTALINSSGSTLNYHGYTNNIGNQRISQTWTNAGYVAYTHDNDGQLKSAIGSGGPTENLGYAFDQAQNVSYRTNNGTPTAFTVDNLNQLTGGPDTPYGYDTNGNLTSKGVSGFNYAYDAGDRLTNVTYTATFRTDWVYDGLDRLRVRREYNWNGSGWVLASTVNYIYDGRRVIQERDGSNTPSVSYTRGVDLGGGLETAGGIGGLLARSSGYSGGSFSTHYYYHADGGGNITFLMDSSQGLAAKYRYDPYGNRITASGPQSAANVYQFSSKEWHTASGLYYYGFRFYDPNLQLWLNRDPIGEREGVNLYDYVSNSPLGVIDP